MSSLKLLQSATCLADLAVLLGYKTKALSYILHVKPAATKYTSFELPKRNGGTRKILAPSNDLKLLQRRLANLLQDCADEIRLTRGVHDAGPKPDQISHGFRRARSIATNAARHRHRRYVFNLDLADFFPTCNFGRVQGILVKDKNYALHPKVAQLIAQIACHEGSLPQGSPCSPCISNIIAHVLDIHLVRLARSNGCVYSRYADDLTFSTNQGAFPKSIAIQDPTNPHLWRPGAELEQLIEKSGFAVNKAKTRMQYRDSRQEVTGLIVNDRVNVRSDYRHLVRAMVHKLLRTGSCETKTCTVDATGKTIESIQPVTMAQLQGMLGFIDSIDRKHRPAAEESAGSKSKKISAYAHFLLYSNFYAAERPVIITEGKTDVVYITHAIRQLAVAFPTMATINADGSIKLLVRIFKYAGRNTGKTIGLVGGSGDLSKFIHTYKSAIETYTAPATTRPIILVVDNDDGGKKVKSSAEAAAKTKFTGLEPFVHVVGNLYLVWTPLTAGAASSCIEDAFNAATKSIKVAGKTFNPASEGDTDTEYGKAVFAYKVVEEHASKIDFSGFRPLLSRLSQVLAHHASKMAV
jgi:hypothetical protein